MEAYWLSVFHCEIGEEYNIGGTDTCTVGEFLDELISHSKCKIHLEQDPSLIRPVDVTMQIPDVSKFRNKTGWEPRFKLKDSIQFLLDYYRKIIV